MTVRSRDLDVVIGLEHAVGFGIAPLQCPQECRLHLLRNADEVLGALHQYGISVLARQEDRGRAAGQRHGGENTRDVHAVMNFRQIG